MTFELDGVTPNNVVPARRQGRLRLVPFSQISVSPQRRDLVKGIVPRSGLTVVWGPPKSGKSFIVFDMMLRVALDWPYRGRRVSGGPVVYCAFEGQVGIEARVEAFRSRFLGEEVGDVPFFLEPVTLTLASEHAELIVAIRQALGAVRPVAIVLDTLNRSFSGSESSDQDMTAYVRAVDAVREAFDCAIVVVHHCGIDGTRPRGHTSLTGAADAQIAVSRDLAGNIIAKLECAKDGPHGDEIVSRLEVVDVGLDEDGEPITSCVVMAVDEGAAKDRPRRTLKPGTGKLMAAFGRLLDDGHTHPAPAVPGVSLGAKAVLLSELKEKALDIGLFPMPEPGEGETAARTKWRNGRAQAWKRAVEDAERLGLIRQELGFVWDPRAVTAMTNGDEQR